MIDEILCTVTPAETRIAVIDDGRVAELFIEITARPGLVGNIYLGRVTRVLKGMDAAFIDLGEGSAGFLGLDKSREEEGAEVSPGLCLREGGDVMVQVLTAPQGGKGAGLSINPTLPGRYLVHTPGRPGIKLSRRLPDEAERARLTALLEAVMAETGRADEGFILRTAAAGAGGDELTREAAYLRRSWAEIEDRAAKTKAPALIFADLEPVSRVLRDRARDGMRRIRIDDGAVFAAAKRFCRRFAPAIVPLLDHYTGDEPMFELHGLEEAIEAALAPKVDLPCGGYLAVEATQALTAIDVNTGRHVGASSQAQTILDVNLAAAQEIARQVRLRNIAGLIVIDFVHMDLALHRARVLEALNAALADDPTFVQATGISELGLVELSRRRGRAPLREVLTTDCEGCSGAGRVASPLAVAARIVRALRRQAQRQPQSEITVVAAPRVIEALEGEAGASVERLRASLGRAISLAPDPGYGPEQYEIVLD